MAALPDVPGLRYPLNHCVNSADYFSLHEFKDADHGDTIYIRIPGEGSAERFWCFRRDDLLTWLSQPTARRALYLEEDPQSAGSAYASHRHRRRGSPPARRSRHRRDRRRAQAEAEEAAEEAEERRRRRHRRDRRLTEAETDETEEAEEAKETEEEAEDRRRRLRRRHRMNRLFGAHTAVVLAPSSADGNREWVYRLPNNVLIDTLSYQLLQRDRRIPAIYYARDTGKRLEASIVYRLTVTADEPVARVPAAPPGALEVKEEEDIVEDIVVPGPPPSLDAILQETVADYEATIEDYAQLANENIDELDEEGLDALEENMEQMDALLDAQEALLEVEEEVEEEDEDEGKDSEPLSDLPLLPSAASSSSWSSSSAPAFAAPPPPGAGSGARSSWSSSGITSWVKWWS